MNIVKSKLASLAEKERTIGFNFAVESYFRSVKHRVEEVLDYSEEEKQEIDSFMPYVYNLDDLISAGKGFANSLEYGMFVGGYNELSIRTKKHFEEIYEEYRLKYLLEKIHKNLVNLGGPKNALNNYFTELKNNYPDFDLQYFYKTFPNSRTLLDKMIKK